MARALHPGGGAPREFSTTDLSVPEWFIQQARDLPVTAVPAGQDADWQQTYRRALQAQPDVFEAPGDADDGLRVRAGAMVLSKHVVCGDVAATLRRVAAFRDLRSTYVRLADAGMLVSVPHPVDLAALTFLGRGYETKVPGAESVRDIARHLDAYVSATAWFMTAVNEAAGADVRFELAMPSVMAGLRRRRKTPGGTRSSVRWHARATADLLRRLPRSAEVVLDLSYGGQGDGEAARPADLGWAVRYLDQLGSRLVRRCRGRALPMVVIPAARAGESPSTRPGFYAPLERLSPRWERVIAGVATTDDLVKSSAALAVFEVALGRPVFAVAVAGGLACCTADQAVRAVRVQRAVASDAGWRA